MVRTQARRIAVSSLTAVLAAAAFAVLPGGAQAAAPAAHASSRSHHHIRSARRRHHHHARHVAIHFGGGLTVSNGRSVVAPQVPAGPCPNADLEPSAANLAQINQATICLTNKERVKRGLAALAENAKLDAAAAHHNNDMIANNYFDHISLGGETPEQRIRAAGYIPANAGYEIGENIATATSGLDTPAEIVAAWMNSPDHRANILDPNYRETGLAATAAVPAQFGGGQPGGTYTQAFGVIN